MKAYLVANITVTDPERYAPYRAQVPAVIARHGGRFLVRAGKVHPMAGDFGLDRFVIVEFDSLEAAQTLVERLDRLALARGSRITRTLAQEVLGEMVGGGDFAE